MKKKSVEQRFENYQRGAFENCRCGGMVFQTADVAYNENLDGEVSVDVSWNNSGVGIVSKRKLHTQSTLTPFFVLFEEEQNSNSSLTK